METGVSYNKLRLHRMGYFEQLLSRTRRSATAFVLCCSSAASTSTGRSGWIGVCFDRSISIRIGDQTDGQHAKSPRGNVYVDFSTEASGR
jgi:hypothetical protein